MANYGEEFEKIYVRYFNDVFLFLKKLSKDESIAEEITSETFFKYISYYRARRIDAEPNSINRQRLCKGKVAALLLNARI